MGQMKSFGILVIILLLFLAFISAFTVQQTQVALVVRLGKLETNNDGQVKVYGPGLHFRIPFITNIVKFDTRLQTLEIKDSRIVTSEKKDLIVSSFVKWRIENFPMYYRATNNDSLKTELLLEQKVNDALRAQFGQRDISEIVSGGRGDIMTIVQKQINESAQSLGIDVTDVRLKRIDLPPEVSESVYDRMRAEREQAAASHRANGERQAEIIRAQTDRDVNILLSKAQSQSKVIRGEGDAKAAQIYSKAYANDPEFYAFYKSLEAYKNTFKDKDDILVLSPESDYFKYFNQPEAKTR